MGGRRSPEIPDIGVLERMPPAAAKAEIQDCVASARFADFLARLRGQMPVAVLDSALASAIDARAQTVRLSDVTARKQARDHPELDPSDYLRVQLMIDRGEAIRQGPRHLVFPLLDHGKWYLAVLKATRDGRELYLQSYYPIRKGQVQTARRRGKVVRDGK